MEESVKGNSVTISVGGEWRTNGASLLFSVGSVCFIQAFGTVGRVTASIWFAKIPVSLLVGVLFWNRWRRRRIWGTGRPRWAGKTAIRL